MSLEGEGLFWNGRAQYEKESGQRAVLSKVLITVKAAPQPSTEHGDTVCVAGIRQGPEGPEWIRLYPIPFRHLDEDAQFKKYDVVEVPVRPAQNDRRSESYRPDLAKLAIAGHLDPGKNRVAWVGPLVDRTTACEALRFAREGKRGPSLLAITPKDIGRLKLSSGGEWTDDERAKLNRHLTQETLFGPPADKTILQKPRFAGHFKYRCQEATCKGHEQGFLDWEFVALQRRHSKDDTRTAMDAITRRYDEVCAPEKGPAFFLGNQAKREHVFSVLGIFRTRY